MGAAVAAVFFAETQTDLMKKGLRQIEIASLLDISETQTDLMKKGLRLQSIVELRRKK